MPNPLPSKVKYYVLALYLSVSFSAIGQEVSEPVKGVDKSSFPEVWEQAMVNATGGNFVNGVNVFYKIIKCSSSDQIILKFVNTNDQEVLIEWADGIYTKDKKWIHNERNDKSRELRLKANEYIEGSCNGSEKSLRIDVADYVSDPKKTYKFAPSFIDITK